MARAPRFLAYLDIPLQHSSRRVLEAMKRGGNGRSYLDLIARARALVPSIALRTTMIVGFPGEGEREFDELLEFVERARFDHLGVFSYSWQEENPGAELGDPVPDEVKADRRDRLLAAQQAISLEHNRALVGTTLPALVAGRLPEMELLTEGRLQRQAPEIDGRLLINDGTAPAGSLVEVEITDAHPYDVVGRLVAVTHAAKPRPSVVLPVRV
jgi:ribosomal protein S12 methylthiotransferase